jgi:cell division septation protein DedD
VESSESREPSYYEVALTNRQVLVAFVALLICLLAAFLSGVWIGRGGGTGQPPPRVAQATPVPEATLEQLTFFTEKEPGARTGARREEPRPAATAPPATPTPLPAPGAVREDPTGGEAMRRNIEEQVAAAREPAPTIAVVTPAPTRSSPPRPTPPPTAPAAAATPAAGAASSAAPFFVQVYSSTNGARAREIVAQLRKAGFKVQLSESARAGATNYRVRVGPYGSREGAQAPAERLRREFRLDTWVTDTP